MFRIWVTKNVCGCWHFCIFEIICELLQPLQEVSQAVSSCLLVVLSKKKKRLLIFGASHRCPETSSSIRTLAGLEEVLDESCGNDVEDELALGLDDNPGTATGTKISVLQKILLFNG